MMNRKLLFTIVGIIVAAVAVLYVVKPKLFTDYLGGAGAKDASNESEIAFFNGKTITYIVSTNPGGNYDAYGRLIASYMEKKLPGVRIVVKNVPGAGHIIGANQIFHATPDGLTIGTFNTGLIYAQILNRKGVRFNLSEMSYLGKAAADPRVLLISSKSPYKSFADLQNAKEAIKMAAAGVGSAAYNETKLIADAFNLNVDLITGFRGNSGEMAMLRGEVQGQLGSLSSMQQFVNTGDGRFVMQIGGKPASGVPRATDLADTEAARAIVNLITSQAELARLTAGPPGIPAKRLQALRAAYQAALEDPGFLADAQKRGMPVEPLYGEQVREQVVAALTQNPKTQVLIAKVMLVEDSLTETIRSDILELEDGNKIVHLTDTAGHTVKTTISGSRTQLTINGETAKRDALKVGMRCDVEYSGPGTEATRVSCQ